MPTERRALVLVAALGLAAAVLPHFLAISPYWSISPDSASYVGGAQSLAQDEGYTLRGQPISPQPPMTSLIYAATILLGPSGYVGMRVVTVAFLLLGLGFAFVLLRREVGATTALAIVAASLGSVVVLQESTRLLSEMFYLCFSFAALMAAPTDARTARGHAAVLCAVAMLLAVLTRTIGVALPIALLLCHGARVAVGRERVRAALIAAAVVALVAAVLWDRAARDAGFSYVVLLGQKQIWVEEAGRASPFDVVVRFVGHLPELGRIGRLLTNDALGRWPALSAGFAWLTTGLALAGLAIASARSIAPTHLYVVVYLAICLVWPEVVTRFFVPIVPLLWLYVATALGALATLVRSRTAVAMLAAVWAFVYVQAGWPEIRAEIAEQHRSPLGDYPIKYPRNYDGERLALWLRDHTPPDTVYASPFPDVYDFVSERSSIALPWTHDAAVFLAALAAERVAYVLVSAEQSYVATYVAPIVAAHPERFVTVVAAPEATLYAFKP